MSTLEDYFLLSLKAEALPAPRRDLASVDFVWPRQHLAVSLHGGVDQRGRAPTTEAEQALAEQGYTLLRFTPRRVRSGEAVDEVKKVLGRTLH